MQTKTMACYLENQTDEIQNSVRYFSRQKLQFLRICRSSLSQPRMLFFLFINRLAPAMSIFTLFFKLQVLVLLQKTPTYNRLLKPTYTCRVNSSLSRLLFFKQPIIGSNHCVKSVQIRSFFWSECGKIRSRKIPYLGTFYAMNVKPSL